MREQRQIGIGIVGGGYMGKAHAVAMASVGAIFDAALRPRLATVAASTRASAERYARAYGFDRAAENWQDLVDDPTVDAVIIATHQDSHRAIAEAALARGKPVFCEKPLGLSTSDSTAMLAAAERAGVANMVGFNYIRTPASQYARTLIAGGDLGRITYVRAEHVEDYESDPTTPAGPKSRLPGFGALPDIGSHVINAVHGLIGPIGALTADIETVHKTRPGPDGPEDVLTDDQGQFLCRFTAGAMGHVLWSRTQTGRKMGYAYEIFGTEGALRFDQEDQNALWLYRTGRPEAESGFTKILAGPAHPDYLPFSQGPGHGTGYQETVTLEARDFLRAIETGEPVWPTFREGHAVNLVMDAARASNQSRSWVDVER